MKPLFLSTLISIFTLSCGLNNPSQNKNQTLADSILKNINQANRSIDSALKRQRQIDSMRQVDSTSNYQSDKFLDSVVKDSARVFENLRKLRKEQSKKRQY
jgi:hypothetical protein